MELVVDGVGRRIVKRRVSCRDRLNGDGAIERVEELAGVLVGPGVDGHDTLRNGGPSIWSPYGTV
jgi:hypothetical protein